MIFLQNILVVLINRPYEELLQMPFSTTTCNQVIDSLNPIQFLNCLLYIPYRLILKFHFSISYLQHIFVKKVKTEKQMSSSE